MSLKEYNRKRRFGETPEPPGQAEDGAGGGQLRFVVQLHDATKLHFDVRLEVGGVFKSWAVPKGPSLDPNDQRLAVQVEDHPLAYGGFEGIIPPGNYGAGTVMIWDDGTFVERSATDRAGSEAALERALADGHVTVVLSGRKLAGEFALVRLEKDQKGKAWLMVKKRDAYASYGVPVTTKDRSVATGRSMAEIAAQAEGRGEVWLPGRGPVDASQLKAALGTPAADPPRARKAVPAPQPPPATAGLPVPEALPRLLKPMLHSEASVSFDGSGWLFEPRLDGQRALATVDGTHVRLVSRQGLAFNTAYPDLVTALRHAGLRLLLDGEIVVLGDDGQASPELLKAYARERQGRPVFLAYDLLHAGGVSWREQPLAARKAALAALPIFGDRVRLVPDVGDAAAAAARWSRWVARHGNSLYKPGVSPYWVKPPDAPAGTSPEAGRVPLTNLDRVYFPAEGYTKGDLVAYYESVAAVLLPYLEGRPQSLNRHPDGINGESFFQKDMAGFLPSWTATTRVESKSAGRSIDYLLCQNKATLLFMANLGCIELNPWLSRVPHLDEPSYAVIDLDPDEQTFDEVVEVALAVKARLDAAGLTGYCKTSGATGIHIYLPLVAGATYDAGRALAELICRQVEAQLPELTTTERTPSRRRRRLYLDYMQNRRGQTLAAPYCVRPRPGAPVSAPLRWDEVRPGLTPLAFTIRTMPTRLAEVGDLWRDLGSVVNDPAAGLAALIII